MRLLVVLAHRLRSLFFGRRLDADARAELRDHFERQVELHVAAGMTPAAARRAATLEVGDLTQLNEACRDARGLAWWDALRGDLRHALRQIRTRPGFASAAILTIALAIGATAAVFAVVDAVVLTPLPYRDPQRLFAIYEVNTRGNVGRTRATPLNFLDWQQQSRAFSAMGAYIGNGFTLTGSGDAEFVLGQLVSPNVLDILGVQPAIGRGFMAHENEAGSHRVVILTHALWQRRYGGDPAIVGRTILVNAQPYHVIGILPHGFSYPTAEYELLVPLVTKGTVPGAPPINRSARYFRVVARLAEGSTEEAARQELDVIGRRLADAYPETNATVTIGMLGLQADTIGDADDDLLVVLASVAVVLLIACLNTAGLSIARGSARARELAVRAAIGASRGRIVRQLATEGVVLFVIGGGLGVALAAFGVQWLSAELASSLPRADEIAVSWRLVAFASLLTLAAGLLFSVLPALTIARGGRLFHLADARRLVSASRPTQRMRATLIVAQIAAAVVLLAGAALALRSFDRVRRAETGFDAARAMTFGFVMRDTHYPTAGDMRAFAERTSEALESVANVEAAGVTSHLPLSNQNLENGFTVDGLPVEPGQDPPIAGLRGVSGHYRAAIGARLLQGRDLLPGDTTTAQPVAVVTDDFVRRYVRAADPLGARLKMGGPDSDDPWRTIVGVIADLRHTALDRPPRPEVWLPFAQMPDGVLTTWMRGVYGAARTAVEPEAVATSIRAAMRALDDEMPLRNLQSLGDLAHTSTAERRLETFLLTSFAALALLLAAVGLFGVLAFHVAQHMPEFGVRLALGATPSGLLALVIRRGLVLLAIGLAIGLPAALLAGRGMSSLLYDVAPTDPVALASAVILLIVVTLAACALPARRAMRTDPLVALRND